MNNNELFLKFLQISEDTNSFNNFEELKKINKQYKKTTFYKSTKMNILKAYNLFVMSQFKNIVVKLNRCTEISYLSSVITDIIDGIDVNTLDGFVDKIMNMLDLSQLKNLQGDLTKSLDKLKNL